MARRNQKDWVLTKKAFNVGWWSNQKYTACKRFQLLRSDKSGKNSPTMLEHKHVHICIYTRKILRMKSYVITDFTSKRKEEFFKTHSPTWLSRMGQVSHFISTFVYYIQKKEHSVTAAAGTVHKRVYMFNFVKGLSFASLIAMTQMLFQSFICRISSFS